MNSMDNTTHQLHYPVDDATTQAQRVPTHAGATGSPAVADSPTTLVGPPTGVATPPPYQRDASPYQDEPPAYQREQPAYQGEQPPYQGEQPGYPVELEVAVAPPGAHAQPEPGRGRTTIADEVVERVIQKVVDLTVDAVEGVHGLRPGVDRFFDPETTTADRAVAVALTDEQARINIAIEVEFGYAVHEVVDHVRASVITSTERLLGLTVAEVNVVVAEVSFADAASADAAAGSSGDGSPAGDSAGSTGSGASSEPGAESSDRGSRASGRSRSRS